MATLRQTLTAAGILTGNVGQSKENHDLDDLLRMRLEGFTKALEPDVFEPPAERDLRCRTGLAALHVVERINSFLKRAAPKTDDKPLLGARDLLIIRTSLSLVFKWTTEPVLAGLNSVWLSKASPAINLSTLSKTQDDVLLLAVVAKMLLGLLVSPDATRGNLTSISPILVDRHLSDILKPALAIGWLPKSLLPDAAASGFADIRAPTMRLLQIVQPASALAALGSIITTPQALHITKTTSFLLGRQLLRPDGVRGLCAALFGEVSTDLEVDETSSLDKMDRLVRILGATPSQMKSEDYFSVIIPNCIAILKPVTSAEDRATPPAHARAIAFTISKFLLDDNLSTIPKGLILAILHKPWRTPSETSSQSTVSQGYPAFRSLEIISALITNTYPSRGLVSMVLSPIVPPLYTLYAYLGGQRASDPTMLELCRSLFVTWAKIADVEEAREVLWSIVQGQGGTWSVTDGELSWLNESPSFDPSSPLSTLPTSSSPDEVNDNPFNLHPAPKRFVDLLKETERSELVSELFVKTLGVYLTLRREDGDPLRLLLLLQLVAEMQSEFTGNQQAVNIFKQPQQILSLIHNALENERPSNSITKPTSRGGLGLDQLRIVPDEVAEATPEIEGDSDDEAEGEAEKQEVPSDIASTAVTLLLALLEALPELSLQNNPLLDPIWDQLQPLTRSEDHELAKLAREARLVLSARLASGSTVSTDKTDDVDAAKVAEKEKYQKALKLLQDPILPVKAHGLVLLKEVVSPPPSTIVGAPARSIIDVALIPGIMSIFMDYIQDDDSYIFLNAVQGLSALASHAGRETLKGVLGVYTKGLDHRPIEPLSKKDIDIRLRVGEALTQVIRQLNQVLPAYSDLLVSPLFNLIGERDAPTVIRISTLSILAQCVEISPQAVAPYRSRILRAMLDLLEIESLHAQKQHSETKVHLTISDDEPITTDTKVAEFRRAALHLLGILLRDSIKQKYAAEEDMHRGPAVSISRYPLGEMARPSIEQQSMERIDSVLGYISATDVDSVVRFMAQELLELIHP